ncbi:MAG: PAS domain-containing sensor histidine kinase, partial [Rickettsiales bacterium]|nr:PAS domain-containing sensor histidine kinase [Rickettsiales bacterium]
ANLIGRYPEGDDQEKRVKHINRIRNSVQNLTNILNDFLSLEKLESGAISLKIVQFSLKEIYDEIMEAMELSLKPGQDLHTEFDDNLTQIISDQHLIKNISLNLLSNAIKYSPENANIEFSIKEVEDSVIQIRVKDEGIGIPKKEQSKLFQRFYRAENATNIQGTGLGLNIVKRYLDLLKGEISFTSKEGLGTEFIVNFPYRKP